MCSSLLSLASELVLANLLLEETARLACLAESGAFALCGVQQSRQIKHVES